MTYETKISAADDHPKDIILTVDSQMVPLIEKFAHTGKCPSCEDGHTSKPTTAKQADAKPVNSNKPSFRGFIAGTISGALVVLASGYGYLQSTESKTKLDAVQAATPALLEQGQKIATQKLQPQIDRLASQAGMSSEQLRQLKQQLKDMTAKSQTLAFERDQAKQGWQQTIGQRDKAIQGWKASIAEGDAKLQAKGRVIASKDKQLKCYSNYRVNDTSVGWGAVRIVRAQKANCGKLVS